MHFKHIITTLTFLVSFNTFWGQTISFSDPIQFTKENKTVNVLYENDNNIITIEYSYAAMFTKINCALAKRDKNFNIITEVDLNSNPKGKKIDLKGFYVFGKKIYQLGTFTNTKEAKTYMIYRTYDLNTFQLISDYQEISFINILSSKDHVEGSFSINYNSVKDRILITGYEPVDQKKDQIAKYKLAELDSTGITWQNELNTNILQSKIIKEDIEYDTKNNIHFLFRTTDDSTKLKFFSYYNKGSKLTQHTITPKNLLPLKRGWAPHGTKMYFSKKGDAFLIGYYRTKEGEYSEGIFKYKLDLIEGKTIQENVVKFDGKTISEAKLVETVKIDRNENGLIDCMVRAIFEDDLGDIFLVGEEFNQLIYKIERTTSSGSGDGVAFHYILYRYNTVISKIKPNETIQWTDLVPSNSGNSIDYPENNESTRNQSFAYLQNRYASMIFFEGNQLTIIYKKTIKQDDKKDTFDKCYIQTISNNRTKTDLPFFKSETNGEDELDLNHINMYIKNNTGYLYAKSKKEKYYYYIKITKK